MNELASLSAKGYYDFSFISQDSSSYGRDMNMKEGLCELIEAAEALPGIRSARILYLYPSTTTERMIDHIAQSDVFATYYDMPIQHIDDRMLKLMKRGFGESRTIELLELMRSKSGSFVRTSVIAGHPGETQESFERLCRFLEEYRFDRINVFAYSNEEDTAAYNMEQIDQKVIEERVEILADIARRRMYESLDAMVGTEVELAVDSISSEHEYLLSARPLNWAPEIDSEVLINDKGDLDIEFGKVYRALITQRVDRYLTGTIISEA